MSICGGSVWGANSYTIDAARSGLGGDFSISSRVDKVTNFVEKHGWDFNNTGDPEASYSITIVE